MPALPEEFVHYFREWHAGVWLNFEKVKAEVISKGIQPGLGHYQSCYRYGIVEEKPCYEDSQGKELLKTEKLDEKWTDEELIEEMVRLSAKILEEIEAKEKAGEKIKGPFA